MPAGHRADAQTGPPPSRQRQAFHVRPNVGQPGAVGAQASPLHVGGRPVQAHILTPLSFASRYTLDRMDACAAACRAALILLLPDAKKAKTRPFRF